MADILEISKDAQIRNLKRQVRDLQQQNEMQKRMIADGVKVIDYQKRKIDRYEQESGVAVIPFCGVVQ